MDTMSTRKGRVARAPGVPGGKRAVARRKSSVNEHEQPTSEQLTGDALEARCAAERAMAERDHLLAQMREANERLVFATLRADDLLEQANEARRRAEALAVQLGASEDALRASEAEAQASNRSKDEFLAMLGHELRNPLSPIVIALDIVAMDPTASHATEYALIARQIKQLIRLVDDLLDLSRINHGKIVLQRERLELSRAVALALETAKPLVESKRQTLRVDVPDHGLEVDGDTARLSQVIGNLLTNAAKYTRPEGSITVTGKRRGPMVVLRVRDTGLGISKEMLSRIFDLFAQERPTLDRSPGGLGIGLTIVRSLVSMHGGTVSAYSEGKDRGSEFVIELPAATVESAVAEPGPTRAAAHADRILVVDDNRDQVEALTLLLRKLGHDVRVAFDGPSAVEMVEEFTPEIVLLDIGLPGLDGYEVAQRLRITRDSRDLQLIAVTGYGQAADRRRSSAAGFDAHLVKPIDIATLQRAIEESHTRLHPLT